MKINERFNKDKVWFIADTHFGHNNIIDFCDRPFASIMSMNGKIVELWNNVVKADHHVFHLGDFALTNTKTVQHIIDSLNGKIHLVAGNHESTVLKPKHIREKFETVSDLLEIEVEDDELGIGFAPIVLCHYPLLSWRRSYHGAWHLYGHVHGSIKHPSKNTHDVGVDVNDFAPVSYEKIKSIITKKNLNDE